MLYGLDLFSGIGGLSIALSPWVKTIAFCEIDEYCRSVLLSRMSAGNLEVGPIWDDVRTLAGHCFADAAIDLIYGGFPCQDISVAGAGAGLEGERSGLFFEMLRLIKEIQPAFVFLENVPAIRTRGGERVGKELASLGYDCRWDPLSAQAIGANHKRERWFLLAAHSDRLRQLQQTGTDSEIGAGSSQLRGDVPNSERVQLWDEQRRRKGPSRPGQAGLGNDGAAQFVAYSDSLRGEARGTGPEVRERRSNTVSGGSTFQSEWWATEPDVGRVAHGIPARVDRIRGLGNAVVPLQAQTAFKRLMGID